MGHNTSEHGPHSPFLEVSRAQWKALAEHRISPLSDEDISGLRGLEDPIDNTEVTDIYLPLSELLQIYSRATGALHRSVSEFLEVNNRRTPYVIGIAGSVAVGKSSAARLLQKLLQLWPQTPKVDLITTDGFLYPNRILQERDLMARKGFPESYDRRALLRFVQEVKAGAPRVTAPVYDHVTYDIVPGATREIRSPDILIVEGLNVLQPPTRRGGSGLAVSDFFDFSIYIDAPTDHIEEWYIRRFLALRQTAFSTEKSYFRRYKDLNDDDARARAQQIWTAINLPNLEENIINTRGRASLVLTKGHDHRIRRLRLRKS